jgi:hypothetical protein
MYWFAAPLAVIFALATLTEPFPKSSAGGKSEKDKSEQTDKSASKEKSEQTDKGSSKEKSEQTNKSASKEKSGKMSKGKRHHQRERQE